jgi:hypothetical protein
VVFRLSLCVDRSTCGVPALDASATLSRVEIIGAGLINGG